jgi:hypothetical protein
MTIVMEWLRDKSCRTCNSFQLEIGDSLSAAAEVRCAGCHAFLGRWRDFVSAAEEVCAASPAPKASGSRTRSTTVEVWSKLRPWPRKHARRGEAARQSQDGDLPLLDVRQQTEARSKIGFEYP